MVYRDDLEAQMARNDALEKHNVELQRVVQTLTNTREAKLDKIKRRVVLQSLLHVGVSGLIYSTLVGLACGTKIDGVGACYQESHAYVMAFVLCCNLVGLVASLL